MADFQQYQSFPNPEVAQPLIDLLSRHEIPFETGVDKLAFDVNMTFNAADTRFVVRLQPTDFETARHLEDQENEQATTNAAADHYQFSFSDEELFDVLTKPDEWSSYDVTLAGQLLRQRGRDVTPDTVRLLRQHRTAEMAKPEPSLKAWIAAGYLFALLGGFLGLVIGWHLRYHKKPLPDGRQVLAYSARDRQHGLRILLLGFFGLLLAIFSKFKTS
jgi:hypothetical protein